MTDLFDRLSTSSRYASAQERVAMDLSRLLNAGIRSARLTCTDDEETHHSVLNYGNPPISTKVGSRLNPAHLATQLHRTITMFEPRLCPRSLTVSARSDTDVASRQTIYFDLTGTLRASGEALRVRVGLDHLASSFMVTLIR
jgi:predicted component of type VI protein secretion system